MNRRTITALICAIAAGFSLDAGAELKDNPYQVIIDRNPFGLRPIPPPPPPPDNTPPPAPALEIKLTGITTLLGPSKVFLEFTDPQTKKVERPPAMLEGDPYKDITVVSIDAENNRVKIRKGDAESWLDFEKNGIKPGTATAAAPVPHPGFPGANPAVPPAPAPVGGIAPTAAAAGPARGGLVGGNTASVTAPATANAYNPAATTALGNYQRPVRTEGAGLVGGAGTQPAAAPTPTASQPPMTREQAEKIIEARRLQLESQGSTMSRILPPTALGNQLKGGVPTPGQR
jgi:hypothetical protein